MLTPIEQSFLARAIELSRAGMEQGNGGPFGCVVVKDNKIVGEGCNMVTSLNDPTAHAEVVAIRNACQQLQTYQLSDCEIYTSCEPCPMCLGAIYWARPKRVIYANTREDAATIEFDDAFIYNEINADMKERRIPFQHEPHPVAREVFRQWLEWEEKKKY
ncbi:MAG: nucleoside deaminase [Chitinophagaceae bacterium]|nr:MAG: nucleoside deaminase [Chitinophagaceae bacterium]